jgi:hypothetical protein
VFPAFEQSQFGTGWQQEVDNQRNLYQEQLKPIEKLQQEMYLRNGERYQPLFKKGGSLSKAEQVELLERKQSHERQMKDIELFYKMMMFNTTMTRRSMSK